ILYARFGRRPARTLAGGRPRVGRIVLVLLLDPDGVLDPRVDGEPAGPLAGIGVPAPGRRGEEGQIRSGRGIAGGGRLPAPLRTDAASRILPAPCALPGPFGRAVRPGHGGET